jgi:hypothetical protein
MAAANRAVSITVITQRAEHHQRAALVSAALKDPHPFRLARAPQTRLVPENSRPALTRETNTSSSAKA